MKIVAIPDVHFPWVDVPALNRLLHFIERAKPDMVIQMGDAYDFYSFSSHPRSLNGVTPMQELTDGRAGYESMWAAVRNAAPDATCYQILGNHDLRIRKQIQKKAPEMEALLDVLDFDSLWRYEGVSLIPEYKEVEIGGIIFHHGWSKFGSHMRKFLKPTVCGHLHLGGVEYMNLWGSVIWELNTGFLGDRESLAFKYPPTKLVNWTTGFGYIDDNGPRFIAL